MEWNDWILFKEISADYEETDDGVNLPATLWLFSLISRAGNEGK